MKHHLSIFVVCCYFLGRAFSQSDSRSVPFQIAPDTELLIIPVSTGGAETTPFALDTGSGVSVLAQSLIDRLGGKPAGRLTGFRLTGERMDLQLFTIPVLRVGPLVRHHLVVAGWDGLDKFHLSGMIALDFFRDQAFTLDFVAKRLVFESPSSLALRRRHGSVAKTRFDEIRGTSLDLFAPFKINNKTAECEVDTGSQGYVFATRYMDALSLTPKSSGVSVSTHTTILGNTETRYSAPIDSLTFGDTQIASSVHPSVLFEDIIYDCNIGIDFWLNKRVTFDIQDKELIVSER